MQVLVWGGNMYSLLRASYWFVPYFKLQILLSIEIRYFLLRYVLHINFQVWRYAKLAISCFQEYKMPRHNSELHKIQRQFRRANVYFGGLQMVRKFNIAHGCWLGSSLISIGVIHPWHLQYLSGRGAKVTYMQRALRTHRMLCFLQFFDSLHIAWALKFYWYCDLWSVS